VDLKSDTITVRLALTGGHEVTPISHHQRVTPIAGRLRPLLEAASTKKKNPWAPVATTEAGKLWGEWGLNQALKRAQSRAKRDGWSFHDLRHYAGLVIMRSGRKHADFYGWRSNVAAVCARHNQSAFRNARRRSLGWNRAPGWSFGGPVLASAFSFSARSAER